MGFVIALLYLFILLVAPIWIFILLGKNRQNNIKQGKPVSKWIGFFRGLLTVYFVFFVLFLAASGVTWLVQVPLMLLFGWIPFLIEKIPNMVFNWDGIVLSLGGLIVLVTGGHAFMKWLYGHWGTNQDSLPQKQEWKPAWTGGVVAILFLMFGASIGLIGATHQTVWMLTDKESFLSSSWGARAYDSDAKSNLHNIYLGCKAVWAEKGPAKNCDLATVTGPEYGYVQSRKVVVRLGGTETEFHAVAGHLDSDKWYWMDPKGHISEIKEETPAPAPKPKANDYGY